ncbi:hypothetical protein CIY_06280 [Butyrivibrio fibrisolvens 16/4]|nr:hypothetical protein CIY_06280 [Butyrivibrio fibrisolvens 16/4]
MKIAEMYYWMDWKILFQGNIWKKYG